MLKGMQKKSTTYMNGYSRQVEKLLDKFGGNETLIFRWYKLAQYAGETLINFVLMKLHKVHFKSRPRINGVIFIRNNGKLFIGECVRINSKRGANPIGGDTKTMLVVENNAELIIEDNVGISNSAIYCHRYVRIGKGAYIGGGCKIYDTDFHSLNYRKRVLNHKDDDIRSAPVNIGNGVFLGAFSTVLKGVSIGEKSIVGACSVVTKNIPPLQVWAGNPAKYIRNLNEEECN